MYVKAALDTISTPQTKALMARRSGNPRAFRLRPGLPLWAFPPFSCALVLSAVADSGSRCRSGAWIGAEWSMGGDLPLPPREGLVSPPAPSYTTQHLQERKDVIVGAKVLYLRREREGEGCASRRKREECI